MSWKTIQLIPALKTWLNFSNKYKNTDKNS